MALLLWCWGYLQQTVELVARLLKLSANYYKKVYVMGFHERNLTGTVTGEMWLSNCVLFGRRFSIRNSIKRERESGREREKNDINWKDSYLFLLSYLISFKCCRRFSEFLFHFPHTYSLHNLISCYSLALKVLQYICVLIFLYW